MKRALLLTILALLISSVAMADHIGLYSDASGSSCSLFPGFSTTTTVIHKFTVGATGSHFGVVFPAGSTVFAFNCSSCPVSGSSIPDATATYGGCQTGSVVVGTIIAIQSVGTASIVPPAGSDCILYSDCASVVRTATGGFGYIGVPSYCGEVIAAAAPGAICYGLPTESATWGRVKSLYR